MEMAQKAVSRAVFLLKLLWWNCEFHRYDAENATLDITKVRDF